MKYLQKKYYICDMSSFSSFGGGKRAGAASDLGCQRGMYRYNRRKRRPVLSNPGWRNVFSNLLFKPEDAIRSWRRMENIKSKGEERLPQKL